MNGEIRLKRASISLVAQLPGVITVTVSAGRMVRIQPQFEGGTMSNLKTVEDAQAFGRELNEQELEQASGSGANKGTGKDTSKGAVEHGDILITKLVDVASP
jgi:hypothetical protein